MEAWLRSELQQLYQLPTFMSSDPDETRVHTGQAFKEHELRWNGGRVDAALYRADLGALECFILRYGAAVHIEAGKLDHFMLFQVPLRGQARIRVGSQCVDAAPGIGALVSPTQPLQLDWSEGCEQLLLKISRARIEEACRDLCGAGLEEGPLVFDAAMPLSGDAGRAWQHHLGGLLASRALAGLAHARALLAAQEQTLIQHLLLHQSSNYSPRLWRRPSAAPQRLLRAAEDHIRVHYGQALTLARIAASCGASVRALSAAFRAHHGCSPMEFVRRVRLEAAHAALCTAGPGAQVTDIALACGFGHLGRFAAMYRTRYGRSPLQALRN